MITVELATRLRDAGLPWTPAAGDRFVILSPGMEQDVFYLADMIADLHEFASGKVVGFNGTTEWALDSVAFDQVLWLPREDQLREAIGAALLTLQRVDGGFVATVTRNGVPHRETDIDAERAYARALLALLSD